MNFLIGFNLMALAFWIVKALKSNYEHFKEPFVFFMVVAILEIITILFTTGIYLIFKAF
ncbi:hypothetical protein CB452P1_000042 [Clostridium phage CB452P1]|nr:hypothetical protein CB452P1_000042 [Clostridium phage CB452P1]